MRNITLSIILLCSFSFICSAQKLNDKAIKKAEELEQRVIELRRHFHENPELSNREFNTAEKIAEHLKSLGLEVTTGIAKTGVVGILKGGKPGPVIGLRADIDALPVTERNELSFKSQVISEYNGKETGVMHACGHDTHIAILLGVAEVLSSVKNDLRGTVKFIFQPAEEGAPPGEEGGAELMVKEGVLTNPDVDVIFGLHINAGTPVGQIKIKKGGIMAASDRFVVKIKGDQTHGSTPWGGTDPIAISGQIINGFQHIISRHTELTKEAAVISIGMVQAGVRFNIIPEEATLTGTIRTLDTKMRDEIHRRMKLVATNIAESHGGTAEVEIQKMVPVTYNNFELTEEIMPSLKKAAQNGDLIETKAVTGGEDFAYYQEKIPGVYFFIGGKVENTDPNIMKKTSQHHTPDFMIDEAGMLTGMKAFIHITLDYMTSN
ncbi:amidohydrolase [Marinigracilibium pacificum]|uniref:Amidohydrolase n=1 Tax=Marinigracilibium pacificum TaxID=2729599 RepID=A0A848IUR2_9BACT|nr:amidohydrolase [Marinigracilibium pacificum]NMM46961.1 amidohydrolase [Marinigracilibium pacificum]